MHVNVWGRSAPRLAWRPLVASRPTSSSPVSTTPQEQAQEGARASRSGVVSQGPAFAAGCERGARRCSCAQPASSWLVERSHRQRSLPFGASFGNFGNCFWVTVDRKGNESLQWCTCGSAAETLEEWKTQSVKSQSVMQGLIFSSFQCVYLQHAQRRYSTVVHQ